MYVCMYVCPKIYIWHALSKKVTVTPRSQTNRNVFSAHLNRSVDKSAESRTVPDPSCSNSKTLITECAVGVSNNEHRSIRRSKHAPTGVRDELTVVSKVRWKLTKHGLTDQQRQLELYVLPMLFDYFWFLDLCSMMAFSVNK